MQQLINQCLLHDPDFLNDYIITSTVKINHQTISLGTIRNSTQTILIRKQPFQLNLLPRFRALHRLFKQGVVLADNMFITKQRSQYHIFVIEAYITPQIKGKFKYLQHLIDEGCPQQKMITIAQKLRVLIDLCHKQGENYLCLTPSRVVVQDQPNINVLLEPFQLNQAQILQDFKNNHNPYQNAYLSPELFQRIMFGKQQRLQLNKRQLMLADYWSYGCVLLQMFALASPAFLCVDIDNNEIGSDKPLFQSGDGILSFPNLSNPFSSTVCHSTAAKGASAIGYSVSSYLPQTIITKQPKFPKLEGMTQMATLHTLLSISDYCIKQEIKITVSLFTKFTYYIDKHTKSKNSRILEVQKTINIDNSFDEFQRLFHKQLTIDFQDSGWKGTAKINLGSLVAKFDGKRVWRKPIVGSYPISNSQSKIRISAFLNSPPDDDPIMPEDSAEWKSQTQNLQNTCPKPLDASYENPNTFKTADSRPKSTILAISEQLSNLTMLWRHKQQSDRPINKLL